MKRIPALGDFCISLAGHDMGRTYVIAKIIDPEFVLVCDGVSHKMTSPKKKRVKHIKAVGIGVKEKLLQQILDGTVTDNEIHKAILAARI